MNAIPAARTPFARMIRRILGSPFVQGRIEWAKAVAVLTTRSEDDLAMDGWRPLAWRLGCLACMLSGRRGINSFPFGEGGRLASHHSLTLGAFDRRQLYAGWDEKRIHFHPRQMRYDIEKDGDWCM